jgi:hypothetical protein
MTEMGIPGHNWVRGCTECQAVIELKVDSYHMQDLNISHSN